MNKHNLKIQFKKDIYQDTRIDKEGNVEVLPEIKTMYHFILEKDYFMDNKSKILKEVIKDIKKELEILEEIDKNNDKAKDSWESISK